VAAITVLVVLFKNNPFQPSPQQPKPISGEFTDENGNFP
jgi:hypothetical protein